LIQFSVADKKAVKSCVTPFPEHGKSKCLLASGGELVPPGALSTIELSRKRQARDRA
jgi:hypothetical protein